MKPLREIIKEYHEIEDAIWLANGVITPEVEAMLDANDGDLEAKLDRYAGFIAYQKTQISYLKQRQEELAKRAKSAQTMIDNMRERMLWAMQSKGLKKAKTAEYTYSVSKRKVATLDLEAIPEELQMELTAKGYITYQKKYDQAAIKKEYSESDFVLHDEKTVLNLR